jgi:hypothetical protein
MSKVERKRFRQAPAYERSNQIGTISHHYNVLDSFEFPLITLRVFVRENF